MGEQVRLPVTFSTLDEVSLRGETIGDKGPAIVLVHEAGGDLDGWGAAPGQLAGEGFRILAFDLRGHGASDGDPARAHLATDVEAAIGTAGSSGDAVIVVSAGDAAAGAIAASTRAKAAGIVLISPSFADTSPELPERVVLPSLAIIDRTSAEWLPQVRAIQAALLGWRMVVHAGTDDSGSAMLGGAWGLHAHEHIRAFARQAERSRRA